MRVLTPRRGNIILAVLTLALLPPLASLGTPKLFDDTLALALAAGTATVMAAMALNVLMGYAGQISLGHAALLAAGAYTSGLLTSKAGFPLPFLHIPGGQSMLIGLPAAAVVGGLTALLIGFPALRLRGLYLAIATMGFGFAMQEAILHLKAFSSTGSAGVQLPRRLFGELTLDKVAADRGLSPIAVYVAVALLLALLLWLIDDNIVRTKVGRGFHGIRENDALAQAYAIDVSRYKLLAFVISGAMCGLAGAVYGHTYGLVNGDADIFGFLSSLTLVIIVVVGGMGNRPAVVLVGIGFFLMPRIFDLVHFHIGKFAFQLLPGWASVIGAGLLIVTVVHHPGGFAEVLADGRERRRKQAVKAARIAAGEEPEAEAEPVVRIPELGKVPQASVVRPEVVGTDLLVVEDVTVRFGGLTAVDSASFSVPRGQIVGLIGPNGAGKSTLFNAVGGYLRPESGLIRFLGQEVQDLPAHRRAALGIGRTFQQIGLARNLTVLENLLMAQHAHATYDVASALFYAPWVARKERELEDRAHEALRALGFEEFTHRKAGNLSGGQQRILEMACVLVNGPELLMLDEPSAGMSPAAAENLAVRLRELRDDLGRTVLLIEHNVPMVLDVCDYIYVLSTGSVLAHGTTDSIARRPEVIAAYFGEAVA
ncbi:MAG: branched-chain amino acid ABC transporter ATP-binding protein/permease [Candidatus Dormibacteria bacterium]